MRTVNLATLTLIVLGLPLAKANGQPSAPRQPAQEPLPETRGGWGLWAGFSWDSRGPIGLVDDREFVIVGIRRTFPMDAEGKFTADWTMDVIPVALVTDNPDGDIIGFGDEGNVVEPGRSSTAYGVGISPIGFQVYPWRTRTINVFVSASAGLLAFNQSVPFANARKFNFAFDFGYGAEITIGSTNLSLGYRVHHISNAGTGPQNPGLDARIFYLGVRLSS